MNTDTMLAELQHAANDIAVSMRELATLKEALNTVGLTQLASKLGDIHSNLDLAFDIVHHNTREFDHLAGWWRTRCKKEIDHDKKGT
jgi:hypothetical protein